MKITTYKAHGKTTIEDLEKIIKSAFGDKYTYKTHLKSSSIGGKLMNGSSGDRIVVIKNAYHRTVVNLTVTDDASAETGKLTTIQFSEDTLAWWLSILHNNCGLLGALIIRAIYGGGDDLYEEVEKTIKDNIKGEDETLDVGLGSLFKKKNNN